MSHRSYLQVIHLISTAKLKSYQRIFWNSFRVPPLVEIRQDFPAICIVKVPERHLVFRNVFSSAWCRTHTLRSVMCFRPVERVVTSGRRLGRFWWWCHCHGLFLGCVQLSLQLCYHQFHVIVTCTSQCFHPLFHWLLQTIFFQLCNLFLHF